MKGWTPVIVAFAALSVDLSHQVAAANPLNGSSYSTVLTELSAEGFSGAILVARDEELLVRQAYGFSNYEARIANTPETIFRIGSVTKTFTAVLALALSSEFHFSLDQRIGEDWPELPRQWHSLTLHQLLCHETGVPDLVDQAGFDRPIGAARAFDRLVTLVGGEPLSFIPGSRAEYSNSNTIILGAWLEHRTGRSYEDMLTTHVLRPARLHNTFLATAATKGRACALGHAADTTAWIPAAVRDPGLLDAAGALASTVDDLWTFHRALKTDVILGAANLARLDEPRSEAFSYRGRRHSAFDREIRLQTGKLTGFSAAILQAENDETVVIVLCNRETHNASTVGLRLLQVALLANSGK